MEEKIIKPKEEPFVMTKEYQEKLDKDDAVLEKLFVKCSLHQPQVDPNKIKMRLSKGFEKNGKPMRGFFCPKCLQYKPITPQMVENAYAFVAQVEIQEQIQKEKEQKIKDEKFRAIH